MKIFVCLLCLLLGLSMISRLPAQDQAQNPGAQQDAEDAREKLLKAEDQLDAIQSNSETTKTAVDGMRADVAALHDAVSKLQTDNAALKQQLDDLQAALEKEQADRVKERQVLLDEVAKLVAAGKSGGKTPGKKKESEKENTPGSAPAASASDAGTNSPAAPTPAETAAPAPGGNTPDQASASAPPATNASSGDQSAPPPKPQKGYYHVVASGETLTLICSAYRSEGIKVTVGAIERANGLTDSSVLRVGQKLFIPKPGD